MQLYSTNDKNNIVDLKQAVLESFPKDKGLYMPCELGKISSNFINNLSNFTFQEISFEVSKHILKEAIPNEILRNIINNAITFPTPLIELDNNISTLELFHGPTMAFKDFGARFMGELMSYFLRNEDRKTTILVATSGDTGGAVASGFHKKEGINVIILYPKGKVSSIQEKQITTWGDNIKAIEIDGSFDDCQHLVKSAFLDTDLNKIFNFSSANSINIARLIPQTFYYFEGYKQLKNKSNSTIYVVPSGNFGNLTAGVMAKAIGLPIYKFIAATNINKVVPDYLKSGLFSPMSSISTLSNAMDVGNPSNFPRLLELYCSTWNNVKNNIFGYSVDNNETIETIKKVYSNLNYLLDPHTAVAYKAATMHDRNITNQNLNYIILGTAHFGKFIDTIKKFVNYENTLPKNLLSYNKQISKSYNLSNKFIDFKQSLLDLN